MNEPGPENEESMRALEARARADLRRLVAGTDPSIRARLEESAALASRQSPRPRRRALWMGLPIGVGAAAAGLVALMVWRPASQPPAPRATAADDLALLLNVDVDLLEQMEFYQWLDREPSLIEGDAPSGGQRS